MTSWAKPGVKCVCVVRGGQWYGNLTLNEPMERLPAFGEILTITSVAVTPGGVGLRFEEYPDARLACHVDHFRPLVTRTQEQDVELFQRIANGAKVEDFDHADA